MSGEKADFQNTFPMIVFYFCREIWIVPHVNSAAHMAFEIMDDTKNLSLNHFVTAVSTLFVFNTILFYYIILLCNYYILLYLTLYYIFHNLYS